MRYKLPILLAFLLFISCKKEKPATVAAQVEVTPLALALTLPNNCPALFRIKNVGAEGSVLSYSVEDNGALGGFLNFTNASGRLNSGESSTISVSVKPEFSGTGFGSIAPSDLVLNISTPDASNRKQQTVSVAVRSVLGNWSGTWSGNSSSGWIAAIGKELKAPVSGTWRLHLESIDPVNKTATGSLTWAGTDQYWVFNSDFTSATPAAFVTNRTITFNSANTEVVMGYGACEVLQLNIDGTAGAANPSDAFYGPSISINLNTANNSAYKDNDKGFVTHPYDPATMLTYMSTGNLIGSKE